MEDNHFTKHLILSSGSTGKVPLFNESPSPEIIVSPQTGKIYQLMRAGFSP
jgi:hypothetical protein